MSGDDHRGQRRFELVRNIGQRGFELFAALRRLLRRFAQGDGGFVNLVLQARVGVFAVAVQIQVIASAVDGGEVADKPVQPLALTALVQREHAEAGNAAEQTDANGHSRNRRAVRLAAFHRPAILRNAEGAQQLFGGEGVFLCVENLHDFRFGHLRLTRTQIGNQLRHSRVLALAQVTQRQNGACRTQRAAGGDDCRKCNDKPLFCFHTSSIL